MPKPDSTTGSFRLPPDLPVLKIVPDYDTDTAIVTFRAKNREVTKTFPFTWDAVEQFQQEAGNYVRANK